LILFLLNDLEVHSYDDHVFRVDETTMYAQKLVDNKVPDEMHLFQKGEQGFGSGRAEDGTN
jgi:hypothetical protein